MSLQSIHNSPLRGILRDINMDTMTGWTTDAIAKRETTLIKPRDRSIALGSLLSSYKLLDVIVGMEDSVALANPPLHKRMEGNFEKYKVRLVVLSYICLLKVVHRGVYVHSRIGRQY